MRTANKMTKDIIAPAGLIVKSGFKQTKIGWIPEDWKIYKLGDLVEIRSGQSPSSVDFEETENVPFLKVEDLNNCSTNITTSRFFVSEKSATIPSRSVIFPKRGAAIMNNKAILSNCATAMDSNLMAIFPANGELNANFLYYKLLQEKLFKIADTSTIPQINNKHIVPYKIALPPREEQKKITKILKTWDTAIENLHRFIEQKELRKKGLMQQLLSGKMRLPGFSGEWEEKSISKLFDEIKKRNDGGNHKPVSISAGKGFISQEEKFERVIAGTSLDKYVQLQKGDFAYNKGNSKQYKMGCIYLLEDFDSALVPFVFISFRPKNTIEPRFYKHFFTNHGLDHQLKRIITSGARGDGLLNVNKKDFFKMKIPYPEIEEQRAISKVLESADREIDLLKAKMEKLKEQKKGLMQLLLTGKKRLI